jgi:hypothetical protein
MTAGVTPQAAILCRRQWQAATVTVTVTRDRGPPVTVTVKVVTGTVTMTAGPSGPGDIIQA